MGRLSRPALALKAAWLLSPLPKPPLPSFSSRGLHSPRSPRGDSPPEKENSGQLGGALRTRRVRRWRASCPELRGEGPCLHGLTSARCPRHRPHAGPRSEQPYPTPHQGVDGGGRAGRWGSGHALPAEARTARGQRGQSVVSDGRWQGLPCCFVPFSESFPSEVKVSHACPRHFQIFELKTGQIFLLLRRNLGVRASQGVASVALGL